MQIDNDGFPAYEPSKARRQGARQVMNVKCVDVQLFRQKDNAEKNKVPVKGKMHMEGGTVPEDCHAVSVFSPKLTFSFISQDRDPVALVRQRANFFPHSDVVRIMAVGEDHQYFQTEMLPKYPKWRLLGQFTSYSLFTSYIKFTLSFLIIASNHKTTWNNQQKL